MASDFQGWQFGNHIIHNIRATKAFVWTCGVKWVQVIVFYLQNFQHWGKLMPAKGHGQTKERLMSCMTIITPFR